MKMLKRNIFILFAFIIGFTTIGVTSVSAYKSDQFPIRPDRIGQWNGVTIYKHVGGNIAVRVWQQGIHQGQQASTKWVLSSTDTGGRTYMYYLTRDYDGAFTFDNVPYGTYSLTWTSLTDAETEGWFYVVMPGGSVFQGIDNISR